MMSELNPVAIILVTSGTRGNRLLFRYPYKQERKGTPKTSRHESGQNPYALEIAENLQGVNKQKSSYTSFIKDGVLTGFSNQTLSNFLIVKYDLCGKKFSVEIDDVRFVGFPISLQHLSRDPGLQSSQSSSTRQHFILSLNVVFVLRARVPESVVSCYQELAQQLTVAIAHEEKRCQYLTKESKVIMSAFEEASVTGEDDFISPLRQIIHHSRLGGELKNVYDSLESSGQVLFYLNQWVEVNFCLPHKIHMTNTPGQVVQLEAIYRCLTYVRPYHGILLTKPEKEVLNFLPLDSSPSLIRLIKLTTPIKNLKTLALETDLSITQIYQLVCHMIYWGFAMLIYPLCQSNLYILSSTANTAADSKLSVEFSRTFPGLHLHEEMSRFNFPSPMQDSRDVLSYPTPRLLDRLSQVVVWLIQHRLLNQLHTYVNLVTPRKKDLSSSAVRQTSMSTHSSSSSVQSAQVVEESYLSVLMEETGGDETCHDLERSPSLSGSEDSGGQSTTQYTSQMSKSPSNGVNSEASNLAEEAKAQWRAQDSLLDELPPQLKSAILSCPASKNADDLHLFIKLCPYFNGKHHLEEMMFYENLRRSHLHTLLDKFKDVLILCSHEDPATSLL